MFNDLNEFLNISFKSTSRNDVIFRYFQGLFNYDVEVPGEKNIIKDLLNSFCLTALPHPASMSRISIIMNIGICLMKNCIILNGKILEN